MMLFLVQLGLFAVVLIGPLHSVRVFREMEDDTDGLPNPSRQRTEQTQPLLADQLIRGNNPNDRRRHPKGHIPEDSGSLGGRAIDPPGGVLADNLQSAGRGVLFEIAPDGGVDDSSFVTSTSDVGGVQSHQNNTTQQATRTDTSQSGQNENNTQARRTDTSIHKWTKKGQTDGDTSWNIYGEELASCRPKGAEHDDEGSWDDQVGEFGG